MGKFNHCNVCGQEKGCALCVWITCEENADNWSHEIAHNVFLWYLWNANDLVNGLTASPRLQTNSVFVLFNASPSFFAFLLFGFGYALCVCNRLLNACIMYIGICTSFVLALRLIFGFGFRPLAIWATTVYFYFVCLFYFIISLLSHYVFFSFTQQFDFDRNELTSLLVFCFGSNFSFSSFPSGGIRFWLWTFVVWVPTSHCARTRLCMRVQTRKNMKHASKKRNRIFWWQKC